MTLHSPRSYYGSNAINSTYSIIIPLYNEGLSIRYVLPEILHHHPSADIIVVDDGSTDDSVQQLRAFPDIRVLSLHGNQGQGFAVYNGLLAAKSDLCLIVDADGQYYPNEFHLLLKCLDNNDLVCGYRLRRAEGFRTLFVSKIANYVRRLIFSDGVIDTGAIKALRRHAAVKYLFPFKGMHRYIPSIFAHHKLKIAQIPITHRARMAGKSKYRNGTRLKDAVGDFITVARHLSNKKDRKI